MKSKLDLNKIERPLVIAGPCSAETEEQVLNSARLLKDEGVEIFRAGIWKPRTRPNCFEGVGKEGLEWMKTVQQETGMQTATEVANVNHVFEALKYGVDILWVGARTSANPFAMQEIANALEGVDIPVLVKNPVNPDVELWMGALERLEKAGIKQLGAIHRGFSSYEHSIYRNIPQWQIPIELKRRMPDMPVICDPSHICGNRELLQSVSQKAMDLNFDGLMIETHPTPNEAWSDAKQQITPKRLTELLSNLELRIENPDGIVLDTLEDLRFKIDQYDNEVMAILQKRMEAANGIGEYKKANNMTILQSGRWESILEKHLAEAKNSNLSERFISKLFKAIHEESIAHQTEIMNVKK
ncbi:bifunctional 3-deoxy-7-phosphoheptulonate synthase/chorismate mutase type II [Ancylomarina sp. DW003]|nr:bifunctional 3-deoxy-7-phosphoheptulonate synthase/chorismate mutase type II [Ancylomarina sp. DW003]MDE5421831.1 bifunctional 3-deoxy-7-phosphoheptulonate synthase/chorismate mutase type II [Ancylomarina sp. DW003]